MAKPNQPGSQPEPPKDVGKHPLAENVSVGERLLKGMATRKEADEFKVAELETWRRAVNSMAASEHGKIVLKGMLDHSGLMRPRGNSTNQSAVDKLKAEFYLSWIRPFLQPELRKELE